MSGSTDEYTYAILSEINEETFDTCYSFIRYQGNEDALKELKETLDNIDWYLLEELSVFEVVLEPLISEKTANELISLKFRNSCRHRKFDGKMKKIDFKFKKKDSNNKKIRKVFSKLNGSSLDDHIDGEVDYGDSSDEVEELEDEEDEDEEEEEEEEEESDEEEESKGEEFPPNLEP
jgi:hypothetical protein